MSTLSVDQRILNLEAVCFVGGSNPNGNVQGVASAPSVNPVAASGAVAPGGGNYAITKSGVAAITLALPTAGSLANGGQDGQKMIFFDTGGHAHTITTPASGINGADHIATFGGAVGDFIELIAYNGVWYALASSGITLS
jgi:hypothetical protein